MPTEEKIMRGQTISMTVTPPITAKASVAELATAKAEEVLPSPFRVAVGRDLPGRAAAGHVPSLAAKAIQPTVTAISKKPTNETKKKQKTPAEKPSSAKTQKTDTPTQATKRASPAEKQQGDSQADPPPQKKHRVGPKRECSVAACTNWIVRKGLCIRHGGKRPCQHQDGCMRHARARGYCERHDPALLAMNKTREVDAKKEKQGGVPMKQQGTNNKGRSSTAAVENAGLRLLCSAAAFTSSEEDKGESNVINSEEGDNGTKSSWVVHQERSGCTKLPEEGGKSLNVANIAKATNEEAHDAKKSSSFLEKLVSIPSDDEDELGAIIYNMSCTAKARMSEEKGLNSPCRAPAIACPGIVSTVSQCRTPLATPPTDGNNVRDNCTIQKILGGSNPLIINRMAALATATTNESPQLPTNISDSQDLKNVCRLMVDIKQQNGSSALVVQPSLAGKAPDEAKPATVDVSTTPLPTSKVHPVVHKSLENPPKSTPKTAKKPAKKAKKKANTNRRPYNRYNIFFIFERENLIKSRGGKTIDPPKNVEENEQQKQLVEMGYNDLKLPPNPPRFANVTMREGWYIPWRKRTRRPHRKTHGVTSFQDLAKSIAASWKTIDKKTLEWCTAVEKVLKEKRVELNAKNNSSTDESKLSKSSETNDNAKQSGQTKNESFYLKELKANADKVVASFFAKQVGQAQAAVPVMAGESVISKGNDALAANVNQNTASLDKCTAPEEKKRKVPLGEQCGDHKALKVARARRVCSAAGCQKYPQRGGVCVTHGAKLKPSRRKGCKNLAKNPGARKMEECSDPATNKTANIQHQVMQGLFTRLQSIPPTSIQDTGVQLKEDVFAGARKMEECSDPPFHKATNKTGENQDQLMQDLFARLQSIPPASTGVHLKEDVMTNVFVREATQQYQIAEKNRAVLNKIISDKLQLWKL